MQLKSKTNLLSVIGIDLGMAIAAVAIIDSFPVMISNIILLIGCSTTIVSFSSLYRGGKTFKFISNYRKDKSLADEEAKLISKLNKSLSAEEEETRLMNRDN